MEINNKGKRRKNAEIFRDRYTNAINFFEKGELKKAIKEMRCVESVAWGLKKKVDKLLFSKNERVRIELGPKIVGASLVLERYLTGISNLFNGDEEAAFTSFFKLKSITLKESIAIILRWLKGITEIL